MYKYETAYTEWKISKHLIRLSEVRGIYFLVNYWAKSALKRTLKYRLKTEKLALLKITYSCLPFVDFL